MNYFFVCLLSLTPFRSYLNSVLKTEITKVNKKGNKTNLALTHTYAQRSQRNCQNQWEKKRKEKKRVLRITVHHEL